MAELWGICDGLGIAWHLGFRKIILESYNEFLVKVLDTCQKNSMPADTLILFSNCMLRSEWIWEVQVKKHIDGQSNGVANFLAPTS